MLALILPYLAKIAKYATKGGKYALKLAKAHPGTTMAGGFLGMTAVEEIGRAGERKMTKEELEMQKLLQEAAAEAVKKQVEDSKINTEKYIKELAKFKKEEEAKAREDEMMQAFLQGQEQNTASMMQALGGMSARPSGTPSGGGMLGIMRQGY